MQKIIIENHGPIKQCELEIKDFIVCTGTQASGKSTVAKSVFFFKNLKNVLFNQIRKDYFFVNNAEVELEMHVWMRFVREIRANFLQIFGTTLHMDKNLYLEYQYSEGMKVQITLRQGENSPNYIWINFSSGLRSMLDALDDIISSSDM